MPAYLTLDLIESAPHLPKEMEMDLVVTEHNTISYDMYGCLVLSRSSIYRYQSAKWTMAFTDGTSPFVSKEDKDKVKKSNL